MERMPKAKIVELTEPGLKRLPIIECRSLLEADKEGYSDEQVLMIRDFLYTIASLDYELFKRSNGKTKIIDLTENREADAQSNSLYQGKYRRAG